VTTSPWGRSARTCPSRAIISSDLPNLFDQYIQYENRITNALLQTLAASPRFLRSFLDEACGIRLRSDRDRVVVSAQKRPRGRGDRSDGEDAAAERDSIPDGWMMCEEGDWAVVVESKVYPDRLRLEQLQGHLRAIAPYRRRVLLVLTPDLAPPPLLGTLIGRGVEARWLSWKQVHAWVGRHGNGRDDHTAADWLLHSLKGFLEMDEALSGFQGVDFPEGFTPRRAKVVLKALMQEIRPAVLKMYPALTGGRPGITLDRAIVWDCFGVRPKFTEDLHLTFSLAEEEAVIGLTLPNAAGPRWRRMRAILMDPAEARRLEVALLNLRRRVPDVRIRLDQRHFIAQRQIVPDAELEFKLDTALFVRRSGPVRQFPIWFETAEAAILQRGPINLQCMVRAVFSPRDTPALRTQRFTQLALDTLRSFKPLYTLLRGSERSTEA